MIKQNAASLRGGGVFVCAVSHNARQFDLTPRSRPMVFEKGVDLGYALNRDPISLLDRERMVRRLQFDIRPDAFVSEDGRAS